MTARQQALTARLRCYYSAPARRAERPHCDGVGAVAYGSSVLCPSCDKMRSAVGRTGTAHQLPGAELAELMAAATELSGAEERVVRALRNARRAGASWPRWGTRSASAARPHNSASAGRAHGDDPSAKPLPWPPPPPGDSLSPERRTRTET